MAEPRIAATAYRDNDEHLTDELRWLDALLRLRTAQFRQEIEATPHSTTSQAMYISHEEVDWLLRENGRREEETSDLERLRRQVSTIEQYIEARLARSAEKSVYLALPRLTGLFRLSAFEVRAVVICLAPELDRKYDKLYAYLQDDITRKRPSVDLILDLLCESVTNRHDGRAAFADHAALLRSGVLLRADDPASPSGSSGLAQLLTLDPRILHFLLDRRQIDGRLLDLVQVHGSPPIDNPIFVDPDIEERVVRLVQRLCVTSPGERSRLALYLQGPYGVGKRRLALKVCAHLGCHLLDVDVEALLLQGGREGQTEPLLRRAFRESLLLQAALYLRHGEALLRDEAQEGRKALGQVTAEYGWLVFIASDRPWTHPELFERVVFHAVEVPLPAVPVRAAAWGHNLAPFAVPEGWTTELAGQFRLTPGQIEDAVAWAATEVAARPESAGLGLADLYRACRQRSHDRLGELAERIEPRAGWDDLVLPADQIAQLCEICSQVRHEHLVFEEWEFSAKVSRGRGVSALFYGPPGTGKTLAAEVVAHELQRDLYKVDLSGVVSKYVGETEKNLARIFEEAETSNAILFFDEADALFGKRTEVSDAHDRYANIETSYLLQRMEAYQGIVILATNLRENMDEAFTRRLRFVVEFPFPDEASRREIWRTHFPGAAPVSLAVDVDILARDLKIAGGNIKNIVLNAAFLAAADGQVIGMEQLLHAARREFAKLGKLWIEDAGTLPKRPRG